MKKTLRFVLLSVMTMLVASAFAQKTVTFDFDNDYQTLFPTLAGVSSNDSHDGDFTEATMSTPVENVMVMVSPDEEAKTASRIWGTSPRLRMYSGTFAVTSMDGSNISKIEFTGHNTNFNMTAITGNLDGKTWTGSDQTVMFMVSKNTQISSIVVTLGEGGDNPGGDDDPGDEDEGFLDDFEFTYGSITDSGNQVIFDFTGVSKKENIEVTGKLDFSFEDDVCTGCVESVTFPSEEMAQAAYQDALADAAEGELTDVKINGKTVSASSTKEFVGYSKIIIKSTLKVLIDKDDIGMGIKESPFKPVVANLIAGNLESGEVTDDDFFIKGIIADIKYTFSAQYGTATFFISEDGKNDYTFQAYSVYYLENKPWVEGNTQIKVGDEVIICGKLTNYKGTPETASKQAYIYSLNGVTKNENGGDTPTPETKEITIAEALSLIDALEDGKTTADEYLVKGVVTSIKEVSTQYGNATFNLADNAGDAEVTVFRAKGFDNESITDENIIKVGDVVVVKGKLQKYVKNGETTPEVSSCYIYSINGNTLVTDITADSQPTVIYNLAGQRLEKAQKGLNIINGKKVMMK